MGFVLGRWPVNLGFSEGSWLSVARVHLADYDSLAIAPINWASAFFTGPQLLYVVFVARIVYGTIFDSCLKSLIKNTTNVQTLEKQASISDTLAKSKHWWMRMLPTRRRLTMQTPRPL